MINQRGQLLTPEEMLKLSTTQEGRRLLFSYIMQARVAFAVHETFKILNIVPTEEQQYAVCDIVYEIINRQPIDKVMEFAQACADGLEKDEVVGNC